MVINLDMELFKSKFYISLYQDMSLNSSVCYSCHKSIKKGKVPKFCHINMTKFPEIPECISILNPIELRLISPRLPFMHYRSLTYRGQKGMAGSVFNVPIDVNSMVSSLPRKFSNTSKIQLRLKRKINDAQHYMFGEVRPQLVIDALNYLINMPLYKKYKLRLPCYGLPF